MRSRGGTAGGLLWCMWTLLGSLWNRVGTCIPRRHSMMLQLPRVTPRQMLTILHDLIMTAVAIVAAFFLRFETSGLMERLDGLLLFLPGFLIYAAVIYRLFHLYQSKWRFAS